jgi:NADPH:quinone reductase-like Zn-dependent oxidoreductase
VLDYHDRDWPVQARAIVGGLGVSAVANAAPNGSADAIGTVRDGGRLATITQDPPDEQRGIGISSVIVEPDGRALGELAELVATGKLEFSVAATFELEEAAEAFAVGTGGGAGGAVVLRP